MQIDNLEDIKHLLNREVNTETLVVFDVDDVLIAPTDDFAFREPIRKKLNKELREKYSKDQMKLLFSDFFRKRTVKLVNTEITKLIKQLEFDKISTTALTGWWTGKYGNIPHMEVLRFKELDDVNISFAMISPFKKDTDFPDLKAAGGIPMIRNGIILTALADKRPIA